MGTNYKLLRDIIILILIGILSLQVVSAQMTFVHPGAINGKAELDYVKSKIAAGAQPWTGRYNAMLSFAVAGSTVTAPTNNDNAQKADAQKAYANALAWYYSGNTTYANNAIGILNVWGNTFTGYNPLVGQNQLQGGWIGALLGPAAEIMRSYAGWALADQTKVKNMFKTAFYPVLNTMSTWNGNVDLTQIDAIMSIAVFCEDETEFNLGIQRLNTRNPSYFYLSSDGGVPSISGDGGNVTTFWSSPTSWVDGLTQETCRDNNHHAQYAMASAFHAAEVAWNQGIDVYGQNSTRYTAVLELMAKQIQTGAMQGTCTNNTTTASLFATWEIGYNHYHNRKGIDLPNTLTVLTNKIRPSGQSDWNIFFETLTHNMDGYIPCPKPSLGPDQTLCGVASINLNSTLSGTGKTVSWYKNNTVIPGETGFTYLATTSGTYKVIVDSTNCSFSDEIILSGSLVVDLGAPKELCNPTSFVLDAGNSTVSNVAYLWNTGEVTQTISVNKPGTYSVTVSTPGCTDAIASTVITSKLIPVVSDTICMAGIAQLSATGTGPFKWYDAHTNGTALFTGSTYLPSINSSTIYYVEDAGGYTGTLGKTTQGTGTTWTVGSTDFGATDKINVVTVAQNLTLKSIAVYVTTANTSVTVNFQQGATTVHTKTFPNLAIGKQTLDLNFNLAQGTYTINTVGTTGNLRFEASGGNFPYSIPGYISFTYNESWQSGWYGIYYDWNITTSSPCLRTSVNAVIDNSNPNCSTNSIENLQADFHKFSAYPNPVYDKLTIRFENNQKVNKQSIKITNVFGEEMPIRITDSSSGDIGIDCQDFLPGLYIIKIGEVTQKIIVQE